MCKRCVDDDCVYKLAVFTYTILLLTRKVERVVGTRIMYVDVYGRSHIVYTSFTHRSHMVFWSFTDGSQNTHMVFWWCHVRVSNNDMVNWWVWVASLKVVAVVGWGLWLGLWLWLG